MNCLLCGSRTTITNTRQREEYTYRRRECPRCKQRFATYEVPSSTYQDLLDTQAELASLKEALKTLKGASE